MKYIKKTAKRIWRRIKIELTWFFDRRILDAINEGHEYEYVVSLVERIADGKERNA